MIKLVIKVSLEKLTYGTEARINIQIERTNHENLI